MAFSSRAAFNGSIISPSEMDQDIEAEVQARVNLCIYQLKQMGHEIPPPEVKDGAGSNIADHAALSPSTVPQQGSSKTAEFLNSDKIRRTSDRRDSQKEFTPSGERGQEDASAQTPRSINNGNIDLRRSGRMPGVPSPQNTTLSYKAVESSSHHRQQLLHRDVPTGRMPQPPDC